MKSGATKSVQTNYQRQSEASIDTRPEQSKGLRNLFIVELRDIYWAEIELTKSISKMIRNTTTPDLVNILTGLLKLTKTHVKRLEEVFALIGEKAIAVKYVAMHALIKEADKIMLDVDAGKVRDSGIIASSKKIELYKITTYGILSYFAKTLGEDKVSNLLQLTLDEEKEVDKQFAEIAEFFVNSVEAAGSD